MALFICLKQEKLKGNIVIQFQELVDTSQKLRTKNTLKQNHNIKTIGLSEDKQEASKALRFLTCCCNVY